MRRGEFVTMVGAAIGCPKPALSHLEAAPQDDKVDPSNGGQQQALRVLLGSGDAQRIDGQSFFYEGRRFRGSFVRTDDGRIVTTVPLEQYLYSVVPREMPPSWPAGALQAQAIIARTFVLQRSSPERDYDLVPSEADQVYTGMDSEHTQSTAAVDATAGQVLRYANGFADAMYSSCCGGHTEASSAAWNGKPIPYLGGVACTYCSAAPWYEWRQNVALDRLQSALAAFLPPGPEVDSVNLDQVDGSGRARFWVFAAQNQRTRVPAAKVRSGLGSRVLPSLRVRTVNLSAQAPRTLAIEGSGLGHGVGLCQWGARGLALAGADARAILNYYYPGTGLGND